MVNIRWLKDVDWRTGNPFTIVNGFYFVPGTTVTTDDPEMIAMMRAQEDFSVEEADNGEAKEGQGEEEKEKGDQGENKTGYVPIKKKRHRRKKKKEPEPGDSSGDHRPADDA